jgi:hypothetical protein
VKAGATSAQAIFTNGDESWPVTFGTTASSPPARGNNMEWIVERIHGGPGAPPTALLMNFGTIQFTDCSGSTATTAAGVNPSQGVGVDMLNASNGVAAIAAVSETTVTVTWQTG